MPSKMTPYLRGIRAPRGVEGDCGFNPAYTPHPRGYVSSDYATAFRASGEGHALQKAGLSGAIQMRAHAEHRTLNLARVARILLREARRTKDSTLVIELVSAARRATSEAYRLRQYAAVVSHRVDVLTGKS